MGKPHCPICGRPIVGQSAEQIVDQVMELPEGTRFMILAPVVRGRKGEYGKLLEELRADGFARVRIDGRVRMLEESIVLDKRYKHDISVVIDRLIMRHDLRKRLADSIETAVGLADGLVEVEIVARAGAESDHGEPGAKRATGARGARVESPQIVSGVEPPAGTLFTFSERFACPEHGPSLVELEPRIFSFNSPHGACEHCTGLGSQLELDPDLLVPDHSLSINEGAILAWVGRTSNYYEQVGLAIAERYGVDLDAPWSELTQAQRDLFLHGTGRSHCRSATATASAATAPTRRTSRGSWQTSNGAIAKRTPSGSRSGSRRSCRCGPARSAAGLACAPSPARCWWRELGSRISPRSPPAGPGVARGDRVSETDAHVARLILREISERLRFLDNVGIGYLSLDRASATLVRRRGPADPPGDPDRILPRWGSCTSSTSPRSACTSATTGETDRDPRAAAGSRRRRRTK